MTDQQLTHLTALTALNRMMSGSYFDVCVLDKIIKLMQTVPDGRAYDLLHTLHCVHWRDMPAELRDAVPKLIERCINVAAHQFQLTQLTPAERQLVQAGTLRLLTREG